MLPDKGPNARINGGEVGDLISAGGSGLEDESGEIGVSSLEMFLLDEFFGVIAAVEPIAEVCLVLDDRLLFSAISGSVGAHFSNQRNSIIML